MSVPRSRGLSDFRIILEVNQVVIVAYAVLLFEPESLRICVFPWEECLAWSAQ